MFSFFTKNRFLVDYLHGLVDIHNHILPGIDDGAKTVDESIELIKGFSEFGMTSFVFTPHIMQHYYPNTPESIRKAFDILQNELANHDIKNVHMDFAAEHMIDENFGNILDNQEVMPLKQEYLLIEMSYLQPSINFEESLSKIGARRLFPIFAHPERYVYLQNRLGKYYSMKEKGVLFQLNLLSLGGFYGMSVKKTALKLIEERLFDYAASDIHNMEQLMALKEVKIGKSTLEHINPIMENTIRTFY